MERRQGRSVRRRVDLEVRRDHLGQFAVVAADLDRAAESVEPPAGYRLLRRDLCSTGGDRRGCEAALAETPKLALQCFEALGDVAAVVLEGFGDDQRSVVETRK